MNRTFSRRFWALGLLLLCFAHTRAPATAQPDDQNEVSPVLERLIEDSKRGLTLMESDTLSSLTVDEGFVTQGLAYIRDHPDHTSYHILFALHGHAREAYDALSADLRARILCAALAHVHWMNDWGYLDPDESYDAKVAKALLETGRAALPYLRPLLDNRAEALLFGSEEATLSSLYKYRRNDFATRYAALILSVEPGFDPDPEVRDVAIEAMAARVDEELERNP